MHRFGLVKSKILPGRSCRPIVATMIWAIAATASAGEPPTPPEQIEFFERQVRPILVEHCHECHGPKKQELGLSLDSREAMLKGSENGPVVVPGDPSASRLVAAIGYLDESLQMPPDGRLPDDAIAVLTKWIELGAPWPVADGATATTADAWRTHWAFQPVQEPTMPNVENTLWVRSPIDRFVLASLEKAGLQPSPPADRRTLIRRLSFDLIGLPPTPDEVERFVNDPAADAVARLVDRLLASPRYGERWGRHWLDIARYADSKGYKFFGSNESFGYTFRDWVIQAFNDDLPYDEFLIRQLAADCLPHGNDNGDLAAMGFLTIGRRFLEDMHDIIDDRIDVVSRGVLGLTVTCARCHDHKFDPIPTTDYYALYGVFAASRERTRTLADPSRQSEERRAYEVELAAREEALDKFLTSTHEGLLTDYRSKAAEYLLAGREAQKLPPTEKFMFVEEPGQLCQLVIGRWRALLDRTEKAHDPVFAPWHEYVASPSEPIELDREINPLIAEALRGPPPVDLREVAARYDLVFASIESKWQTLLAEWREGRFAEAPKELPDPNEEQIRRVLYGPLAPPDVPILEVEMLIGRAGQAKVAELRAKVEEQWNNRPQGIARAMTLEEFPSLYRFNPRVLVRGRPSNIGPEVPRRFLSVLGGEAAPFTNGGGRLDMARRIASPDNPLTARVMVNRVWAHHFGQGLVATPSDFGLRCEPPSHPELLDYLAWRFMNDGWSLKILHRLILVSSTYMQASDLRPDAAAVDPDNRLLARMNRRRLDLESMRDSLLAVSGRLDESLGGFAVPLTTAPFSRRRTVYGFVDRQYLPGLFRTFDFASPDAHTPRRFITTVPQQALYLMNGPFVQEQARGLAARPDLASVTEPEEKIERLYRLLYGRGPTEDERKIGREFVATAEPISPRVADWQYGYGSFDSASCRVASFTPLAYFTGTRWQAGPALPDPAIGWVLLGPGEGHPGESPNFAAIRRWTAPVAGSVSLSGLLIHAELEGDGILARIVSSRSGEAATWTIHNGRAETTLGPLAVQQGDTLDFVVECRGNVTCDQHTWNPRIELVEGAASGSAGTVRSGATDEVRVWDAATDFSGPRLGPWETYAQALLMANEFVFVD